MKKIFELILGLLLIALIIYSLYYFIFLWIPNNTTIAIPLITATIGFIGVIYTQYNSKSRDIRESHRIAKIETYRSFFELINLFQNNHKRNIEIDPNDEMLQDKMHKLTENFILWASDEVIKAWIDFRTSTGSNDINDPFLALKKIDNVYKAIRKDLGHDDKKLKPLDLISMNLSDPNELQRDR